MLKFKLLSDNQIFNFGKLQHTIAMNEIIMRCALREWSCIPLVVEVFGGWGNDVLLAISRKVATQLCRPLNEVMLGIYSRLNLTLMRQNAGAILARCVSPNTCCDFQLFVVLMF